MDGSLNLSDLSTQQRNPAACNQCRSLKVKCVRPDERRPCTKCVKSGIDCVVPQPKRPSQSSRRTRPRMVDLEARLNGIFDLLAHRDAGVGSDNSATPAPIQSTGIDPSVDEHEHGLYGVTGVHGDGLPNDIFPGADDGDTDIGILIRDPTPANETPSSVYALGSTGIEVSTAVLQHLLNNFGDMTSYFPFVQLPTNFTVAMMVAERPFLLLAAVTAAASRYPQLQQTLEEELKQLLSRQVILEGQKSLDILQGLLVHLAWYHFHISPQTQQTYTYLQIAISIVIDLGLQDVTANLLDLQIEGNVQNTPYRSPYSDTSGTCNSESHRAYLGCYYLSTIVGSMTGKPNNLPFSEYMLQLARSLERTHEYDSDRLIYLLIKMQRLGEEVYDIYHTDISTDSQRRVHIHAERLLAQLSELRCSIPTDLSDNTLLRNGCHTIQIQIYEMGLVYRKGKSLGQRKDSSPGTSCERTHPALITNLIRCVDAAKQSFDGFLQMTPRSFNYLPLTEWYHIILTTIVLYRLSVNLPEVPGWNVELARQTVDLEKYLNLLVDRIRSGTTEKVSVISSACSLFGLFPNILDSVKTSFAVAKEYNYEIPHKAGPHGNLSMEVGSKPSAASRFGISSCPGFRNLTGSWDSIGTSKTDSPQSSHSVTDELQAIESGIFWNDVLLADYPA